jgi:hypothetical protein
MKYCEKCKVKIDMDLIKCPLCSAVLIGSNGASDTEDEALKQTVEVSVPEATAEGDVPEAAAEGDVSEAVVEGEVPEAVAEDELPEAAEEDDVPEAAEGKSLEAAAEAEPDGNSGETGSAPTARNSKYPVSAVETANKYNFVLRLFLFISVVIASTCLLINILTFSGICGRHTWPAPTLCLDHCRISDLHEKKDRADHCFEYHCHCHICIHWSWLPKRRAGALPM